MNKNDIDYFYRIGASTRLPPVMQQKREQCLARRDELKVYYFCQA